MDYKISVIIPIFNSSLYLEKCLNSVVNQSYKNLEIICINDGSTDNSLKILNEFAKRDNRIKIYNQKNLGGSFALNRGIECSTGDYIHFLDSDDYLDLNAYKIILDSFHSNRLIDLYLFYFYQIDISGKIIYKYNSPFKQDIITSFNKKPEFLINFYSAQWGKMYKSSLIKNNNIVFDNTFFGYDMLFHLNSIKCANKISILDKTLVYYRFGDPNSNAGTLTRARDYKVHFDCFNNCVNLYNSQSYDVQSYNICRQFKVNCFYFDIDTSSYKMRNYLLLREFVQKLNKKTVKILKKNKSTRDLMRKIIRFNYKKNDINTLKLNVNEIKKASIFKIYYKIKSFFIKKLT